MLQRLGEMEGVVLWYDVDGKKAVITIDDAVSANLDTRTALQEMCRDYSEELYLIGKYLGAQRDWHFTTETDLWFLLNCALLIPDIKDSIKGELDKRLKKQLGYVYFLRADNGLTKIGYTKALDKRIEQLIISLPYKLVLAMTLKTQWPKNLEAHLHEKYAANRVRGEWFKLTEEDLIYIKGVYGHESLAQDESYFEEDKVK